MLSVDEAQSNILAAFGPLPPVEVPLRAALDLTLAEDVILGCDLPPFANSAMDGYAVRAEDTALANVSAPTELCVSGQAAAGHRPDAPVEFGCAVRIMTGAPIPEGADAVVRFEDIEEIAGVEGIDRIVLRRAVPPGENIRHAGEDARQGQTVLSAGARIRPAEIALMAAIGRAAVPIHRRPRVGVLVTGDEVIEPGELPQAGQIWNSNGPMIEAQIRQCGGEPVALGVAKDTTDAVQAKLAALEQLDLLVTTGGVSVGDFDVVKDVLRSEGRVDLWNIRIKPGKPLAFGMLGDTPLIGLPGNPVAASIAFTQFARPAILTMLGRTDVAIPEIQARVLDRIENRGGRRQYVRVRVDASPDGYVAHLAGGQGSAMLTSLARSNGLLVVPESCPVVEPGTTMTVQMTDWDLG